MPNTPPASQSSIALRKYIAGLPVPEQKKVASLNPRFRAAFISCLHDIARMCKDRPYHPRVVAGARSRAEQFSKYQRGRQLKNGKWAVIDDKLIITNAHPDRAPHVYGMAADVWLIAEDRWAEYEGKRFRPMLSSGHQGWHDMAGFARGHGLVSGGDFRSFYKTRKDYEKRQAGGDWPHIEYPCWRAVVGLEQWPARAC